MKLVPVEDRVVVKLVEKEDKTSSGIVLPDTAKEKPQKAKVIAVGPGKYDDKGKLIPMHGERGRRGPLPKYSGTEVKLDGEEYLVLRASDILADFCRRASLSTGRWLLIPCPNEGDEIHGKTTALW